MKLSYSLFRAFIPAIVVLVAPINFASALTSSDVEVIAKSITVRIESQNPGSGVLIKKEGDTYTILTAAHVVGTDDEYEIITPDGESYPLEYQQVRKFDGVDLAVLEFESSKDYTIAEIRDSTELKSGKPIYVSGFPIPTVTTTESLFNFLEGNLIINATRPIADGYGLIYSNPTFTGMSGGAVLDERGKLVGIHGRAYVMEGETQDEIASFKINHNLGISINTYIRSIEAGTVNIAMAQMNSLTADDYYLRGVDSLTKQENTGALAYFDKAIALNPDFYVAYDARGNTRFELGDKAGAIADYGKAIALNPDSSGAYYYRGMALSELGDRVGAIADYDKVIALKPDNADAYYNRGFARYKLGNKAGALTDYGKVIALNPDDADAYYNRGNIRSELGDKAGAITDYGKVIALNPDDANIYYNRGIALSELGDLTGGIVDFNKSIALNPDNADAYYNRGFVRYKLGDKAGAITDYDKSIALNPDFADAYANRGVARFELGDNVEAIANLNNAATLYKQQGNQERYDTIINVIEKIKGSQRYIVVPKNWTGE